jgi:hypothetical protein
VQKIAISLSALLLLAATSPPGAAEDATGVEASPGCVEQIGEYYGCLNHGDLSEAQARTARGHPEFVEPRVATASLARLGKPPGETMQAPAAAATRP